MQNPIEINLYNEEQDKCLRVEMNTPSKMNVKGQNSHRSSLHYSPKLKKQKVLSTSTSRGWYCTLKFK